METQAGFTTGSMIEDNLFTLQYCTEGCYKLKRPLIVTCLDYSKAFDSIRQGKTIYALIHYKIHCKMIDAIANIYRNDYTEVQFRESLLFADDALLLSHSLEEAKENLDIITDVSREFELEINIEKIMF